MSVETVSHHGRTTAYRVDDGPSPTVLCVHGSGGERGLWRGQRRLDAATVAVDLSGHGDSDDVDAEAGYETLTAYADDVAAVAAATDASVLCGSSLGGAVGLHIAIERADEVGLDGLVLAGTGPRLPVLDDLLRWLDSDFERAVEFLHEPDHLLHSADEATLAPSRDAMLETGRVVTERDFRTSHRFDVRDRLDRVDVPCLAVVGEHDRLTPRRYHETLAESIPDCDLAVVPDAAHLAMLERPAAFNDAVTTLLDRLA
jgi:pimeloyl-ACP methyl ester carboxylesterase